MSDEWTLADFKRYVPGIIAERDALRERIARVEAERAEQFAVAHQLDIENQRLEAELAAARERIARVEAECDKAERITAVEAWVRTETVRAALAEPKGE